MKERDIHLRSGRFVARVDGGIGNCLGFSLVEMLVVMAVVAILIGSGLNVVTGMGGSGQKESLVQIANALEIARQTAVSRNTYTYVAFTDPGSGNDRNDPLCVAVFESLSASDLLQSGQPVAGDGDASGWRMIAKPKWLQGVQLEDTVTPPAGLIPEADLSSDFSATLARLGSGQGFEVVTRVGEMSAAAPLQFDRVITFAPNGSALVDNARRLPSGVIGFLVVPRRGEASSDAERLQTAAVTVNGFLGNGRIYQ